MKKDQKTNEMRDESPHAKVGISEGLATPPPSTSEASPTAQHPPNEPFVIASEALLAGRSEVQIRHRGDIYRLTLTKAGKLILHK